MDKDTTVAVDLAKSVFEIAVSPRPGRVSERHRLSRGALLRFLARRPAATVLLEALGRPAERDASEAHDLESMAKATLGERAAASKASQPPWLLPQRPARSGSTSGWRRRASTAATASAA